ncbi:hypothetical protein [Streptomyces coryli]|uniref:hypothetical protein n=1 Tax=Streptomyces coryli TaxID=1128680 RepID=UPI0019D1F47C|nr:hypothetical protein [Streptomyces coryli]
MSEYPPEQYGSTGAQPPYQPYQPYASPPPPPPVAPPAPPRRGKGPWLRAAAALLALALAGGGSYYATTEADRGDLPALTTKSDDRWDYPELKLPTLPAGAPAPFAKANTGHIHHADLRDLLLPAPAGAEPDPDLPGKNGWLSSAGYAKAYAKDDRDELLQELSDNAVRHIAATGWTTPDGTRTRIYLLRFNTAATALHFHEQCLQGALEPESRLLGAPTAEVDESWRDEDELDDLELDVYDEAKPRGAEHVRQAYIVAGDTIALVAQSRKGEAPRVPFRQALVLQQQLLG